ncbi:unnamed protein product [Pleuronectes platessa]|uniref:Uncharacterized protein n=1 Tax=Pleuronectes platessa TaxID=8262 RepID=A0A9N7VTK5_PLEPL|nr:unnamed protein product [Pleuronectes platessa]
MRGREKANKNKKGGEKQFMRGFFSFFLEPSLRLCSQLGMDEHVCWMMELLRPGGGCSPLVSGSDMKLWAAARGPTLPESRVDKDEAAAASAPAPATNAQTNGLDGLLISV